MSKYCIVAESGADIPADIIEKYDISIVPMYLKLGDTSYPDGALSVSAVIDHYNATGELPKTSGASPHDFEAVFDRIHTAHPDAQIIHLAYSAQTTCSFEAAKAASKGRSYVHSWDTKVVTGGQALVILQIAELIESKPEISLAELESTLLDYSKRAKMGFFPDDLAFLHAGGRLSNVAFHGAQILHIKPLIEILDGLLVSTKKYRGSMSKTVSKFLHSWLDENNISRARLFLLNSLGLGADIKSLAESIVREKGFAEIRWVETGSVVTTHIGPKSFGVAGFSA